MKLKLAGSVCLALTCAIGALIAQEPDQVPGTAGPNDTISDVKFGSIVPIVRETGKVSLSVDGLGTNSASGIIQVQKPAGATVRGAYMAAATTGFSGRVLNNNDIRIDGVGVVWSIQTPSSISSSNHWANVTALVKTKIDGAPAGRVNFTISEVSPGGIDGEILAVIFDDPNQATDNTVALLFGAQAVGGDTFALGLADPIDKSDPALALQMGLGIGFGFQTAFNGTQRSTVDVNGVRLSSSAGGQDDGDSVNGALLTVGGLDDSPANPADPFAVHTANGTRTDDELYDLAPLVSNGATTISVFTTNPSTDDNIFFASFFLRSTTAVVGEGIVLAPASAINPVGSQHTVTATMQDSLGRPVKDRLVTFTVKKGPHAGLTDTAFTGPDGKARFTYTGNSPGVDNIEAQALDQAGKALVSNIVVSEFFIANEPPTISCPAPVTVERASPAGTDVTLTVQVTDPDAEPVTVTWNVGGMDVQTDNVLGLPSGPTRVTLQRAYALGSHTVTVTVDDGDAAPITCSTTVTVAAATTSLSVTPSTGTFGETTTVQAVLTAAGVGVANKSVSFTLSGMNAGSATTDNNGVATLPGVSLGSIGAGSYPAAVAASFGGEAEFTAATGTGALTVHKATPTLNVTGGTFTYDGDPHPATGTANGVDGEDLGALSLTYSGLSDAPINAGSYAVIASFAGNDNYNPASSSDATILITKATPTFNISGGTFTYDGDPHPATGTALGAKGEDLGSLTFTYNGISDAPVNVGNYVVVASFGGSDNYNPASGGSASIVITKAAPTVNATGGTFTYDGDPHPATGSATGVDGEDLGAVSFTYNGAGDTPINAGGYAVIATFAGNDNYSPGSNALAQIVINKAAPVLQWNAPADIVFGTPLGAAQLNAAASFEGASLPGTFTYVPGPGSVLNAGAGQALSADFAPADSTNFTAATIGVTLNVLKATPFFSDLTSPTIAFGTAATVLSGRIAAGGLIPSGAVMITVNGVTQAAEIGVDGQFSSAFNTAALPVVYPAHVVTFVYGGSINFTGALGQATVLVTNSREISSDFNSTPILAGNYIWFNSSIRLFRQGVADDDAGEENPDANGNAAGTGNNSLTGPATVHVFAQTISFTVNGAPVVLTVPDAVVRFSATATMATTRFDQATGMWETTVPVGYDGDVFLAGLAHLVPTSYPGKLGPVTWSGTFLSDQTTEAVKWQWGAAVYSAFSTDYPALGVKPVDGQKASEFDDNDKAGTPENFKQYLIKGARSGGQSNHAGSRTNRQTVAP
jgi:hypothetical protein